MMKLLDELKNNKQKQNELLDKIAEYPCIVRFVAKSVNFVSRVVAVCLWDPLISKFSHRYKGNIISLHKIVRDELECKLKRYASMMENKEDDYGFIEHDCCDSLLFTGLVGSTPYSEPIITAARDYKGMWHRRQVSDSCYPLHSRSTISRDMLLGLMWYIWRNNRLDLAEDLWDYGVDNDFIMGEGDVSRIYMTPGLQATLAEIIYQLGGKNHFVARNMKRSWPLGLEGYQCHLQALHILLVGELKGYITTDMKASLLDMSTRYSQNHLYTLAIARFASSQETANSIGTSAAIGLEDISLWPKDRLPTDADRSSRWLFENNDLSAGSDHTKEHTGGDFVFCASLIMDYSDTID